MHHRRIFPHAHTFLRRLYVSCDRDCDNAESAVCLLFSLLGWELAMSGDKAVSFQDSFTSLGVVFYLPKEPGPPLKVGNTSTQTCLLALHRSRMSPQAIASFASRPRWLDGQIFGRVGRRMLQVFLQHAEPPGDKKERSLSPALKAALEWVLHSVRPIRRPGSQLQQPWKTGPFSFLSGRAESLQERLLSLPGVVPLPARPQRVHSSQPQYLKRAWQLS